MKPGPKTRHATPLDETIRGCVQLSEKERVRVAAEARGWSESQVVRAAVLEWLSGREGGMSEKRAGAIDCQSTESARELERRLDAMSGEKTAAAMQALLMGEATGGSGG